MGAVMLLRGKALGQVGLLDEGYFMYSEEVDLCYRLKRSGWKVRYTAGAQATHLWGGSSRQAPAEAVVRLYRSRALFFRKHYGRLAAILFKFILWVEIVLRVVGGNLGYLLSHRPEIKVIASNYRYLSTNVWGF